MPTGKSDWIRNAGLLAAVVAACSCAPEVPTEPVGDHKSQVESWQAERERGLRKPDGWLSLAGLYWLEEGENPFGTSAAGAIVFPPGTIAAEAGVLVREGRKVTLVPGADATLVIEGSPVADATVLALDTAENGPTIVESGSLLFHAIERGEMIGLRLKDRDSEVLADFEGLDYFPIDEGWRLTGRYELFDAPRVLRTPNVLGTVTEEEIHGEVVFERGGKTYRLQPSGDAGEGFFLVFGDRTNGSETYGGGRFVYAEPVREDGTVVVDFNKAYCPPCVFTPFATCPLPPAQNKLALRVEAGEKAYGASH